MKRKGRIEPIRDIVSGVSTSMSSDGGSVITIRGLSSVIYHGDTFKIPKRVYDLCVANNMAGMIPKPCLCGKYSHTGRECKTSCPRWQAYYTSLMDRFESTVREVRSFMEQFKK